ncbi:MAG: FAD-dependent oxidoreductase [Clostridiaceae bacterium]|nr:FAD-dependent oxidoreductase [Clostridiaceae bacterium]
MNTVAIIGFGCAGYHCAKALRENGFSGEIHVFTDSPFPPANPMLTTYYVADKISFERLFPFGSLSEISSKLGLTLHVDSKVIKVDAAKEITLSSGKKFKFDKILIATGASAVIPPIEGIESKNVYYMRTVDDAVRLKQRLEKGDIEKAIVVGASMVGIKVAEIFSMMGIPCLIADMAPYIFPRAAVKEVAWEIQRRIEEKGIGFELGAPLTGIKEINNKIYLECGAKSVEADIAVMAIGMKPNIGFINPGEIKTDNAILVNSGMETSAEGIYAAGDCCTAYDIQNDCNQVFGLWSNAAYQGRTAGERMAGRISDYSGSILNNITHFMGLDFVSIGDVKAQGRAITWQREDFIFHAVEKEGCLLLVNILNNHAISGAIKNYMIKKFSGIKDKMGPMQKGILINTGMPLRLLRELKVMES